MSAQARDGKKEEDLPGRPSARCTPGILASRFRQ
jgi:hypothetical protein